ncbi:F-box protein CPR30-like [Chenopodium quinoa]|uniref:F-box protein CPR30-like n=1 Tax=Chenopodium quinoa TaxID=63459 RepID=UPI000B790967|nr:F-box protein CPR30-like [Chenopodium quinoa]
MGVYVSGCLHWMVTVKPESDGSKLIVAFDLNSEKLKIVPQPKYSPGKVHLNVEVLQQRLCVLVYYPTIRSEVWVMKEYGDQDSWTELFTVWQQHVIEPFEYVRPIALSKDGSKVLLEQDDEKFIWFDLQRQKPERVMIRGLRSIDKSNPDILIWSDNAPSHPEIAVLVESLVFGSCKTHRKKKRVRLLFA